MEKMWAGRFEKALDKKADDFNSSLRFDCRMYAQDIKGSIAHATMLAKQGILSSLSGIHDSPGGIENYYASGALSGQKMTPEQYADAVRSVTRQQVAACAQKLSLHTTYFLKGVQ